MQNLYYLSIRQLLIKLEIEHSGYIEVGFDLGKISDADLKTIRDVTIKAKNVT